MSLIAYFPEYPNRHLLGQVLNLGGIYNTCITHDYYRKAKDINILKNEHKSCIVSMPKKKREK